MEQPQNEFLARVEVGDRKVRNNAGPGYCLWGQGCADKAKPGLILAAAGGSNGCRLCLWKQQLLEQRANLLASYFCRNATEI